MATREEMLAQLDERVSAYRSLLSECDWKPSRSHIETARNLMIDAAAALRSAATPDVIIEKCAKIAEPWQGYWLSDSSTDADRAVVSVRTEIAAKIRGLSCALANQDAPTRDGGYNLVTGERDNQETDPTYFTTTLAANSARVEAMLSIVKSAYYSEPTGTAENSWNDALQHIEEEFSALQQSPPQGSPIQSPTGQAASGLRSSIGEGK